MNKTTLQVSGMTCSACYLGLEKYIKKQKHIIDVEVNLILQTVAITYERPLTKKDLMRFVKEAGFSCDAKKNKSLSWKAFFFFLFLGLFLMYISMGHMFHLPVPDFINKETHPLNYALFLFIATIPFLFYGKDILQSGIKNLLHKTSNMDTLITFGVIVNFLYSLSELVSLYKETSPV